MVNLALAFVAPSLLLWFICLYLSLDDAAFTHTRHLANMEITGGVMRYNTFVFFALFALFGATRSEFRLPEECNYLSEMPAIHVDAVMSHLKEGESPKELCSQLENCRKDQDGVFFETFVCLVGNQTNPS
jgi:hypothetical protein